MRDDTYIDYKEIEEQEWQEFELRLKSYPNEKEDYPDLKGLVILATIESLREVDSEKVDALLKKHNFKGLKGEEGKVYK